MDPFQFGINIGIDLYSLALLIFLYLAARKQSSGWASFVAPQNRYQLLLSCTFFLIIIDFFSRFDSSAGSWFRVGRVCNFLLFFFNPLLTLLWQLYICDQLKVKKHVEHQLMLIQTCFFIFNSLMTIITEFTGWLYYYDADGVYHRGPMFLVTSIVMVAMTALCEALTIQHREGLDARYYSALVLFPIIPLIATILQVLVYGVSLALNSVAFSLLIIFVYVQSRSIETDYLTGLYNRRKLDLRLQQAIRASDASKPFAAVLIDIDRFKQINDTLGHSTGDAALTDAAALLRSCLRSDTFIARYGGDEFCLVLDVKNDDDVQHVIDRINHRAEQFNRTSGKPYQLHFSMGGAVYQTDSHMKMKEFLKKIDTLMYENKQAGSR